jgi:putative GTP pyrophosphokinase
VETLSGYDKWYNDRLQIHQLLAERAENLLKDILLNEEIQYYKIESRVKDFEKFVRKMMDKKYATPEEMTDVVGLRIVGFVPSDINTLSGLVEGNFNIDRDNTRDSIRELADDKVGYRAKNYIVTLKSVTLDIEEYERLGKIPFEIQITTLLAHVWEQFDHDRRYKKVGEFPSNSDIPRRFKLISGTLEILDNEFDRLFRETERYADALSSKIDKGKIDDIPISLLSLRKFLTMNFWDVPGFKAWFQRRDEILDELASMDIRTLAELNMIMPRNFKERLSKVSRAKDFVTFTAILRDILIIHNPEKYFGKAWKHHYNTFDYSFWKIFTEFGVDRTDFPPEIELEFEHGSDKD